MKKSEYILPQIYVVKLRQQPLMQYASPAATPRVQTEEASDPDWTDENDYYNL